MLHTKEYINYIGNRESRLLMKNTDLTSKYQVEAAFSWKPLNDPMVGLVICPVALYFKHRRQQRCEHTIVAYKSRIKCAFLVECQTPRNHGQIVPTHCGNILHASRAAHLPYVLKNQGFCGTGQYQECPPISVKSKILYIPGARRVGGRGGSL